MKIVGYHSALVKGKVQLEDSSGEKPIASIELPDLLDFLLEPYDCDPDYVKQWNRELILVRVCWNLDEFVSPLLKLLGLDLCKQLAETKECKYGLYRLYYIPDKIFSIRYGRRFAQFFSLAQYYQDTIEPPEDAFGVRHCGVMLAEVLQRMDLQPKHWTSPATILSECIFDKIQVPSVWDNEYHVKRESANYALHCCHRIWISNFKVGHWPEGTIQDLDLTSAFPYQALQLYDTRPENTKYQKSTTLINNADWGFLYGDITINSDCSPIMRTNELGELQNPTGTWRDHITLDELRFIEKYQIGNFKLIDGWFLTFRDKTPIFAEPLNRLFSYRGKHFLTDALAKRMSNSLYGLTLQKYSDGRSGKYFNPFFAAQITTRCRLEVAKFIYENELQSHLVGITVDGILVDKFVSESKLGVGMGRWKSAGQDATLVISPGMIFRGQQRPHGVTFGMLSDMIDKHPNASVYQTHLTKRVTLAESLKIDFSLLGTKQKFPTTIDLNIARTGQDRVFRKFPLTGKELISNQYSSEPVRIG